MADIDRDDIRGNIVWMVVGGAIGVLCLVLLLIGIGTPGLWFTAAGMVLLVLSQWMTIRAKCRRRRIGDVARRRAEALGPGRLRAL